MPSIPLSLTLLRNKVIVHSKDQFCKVLCPLTSKVFYYFTILMYLICSCHFGMYTRLVSYFSAFCFFFPIVTEKKGYYSHICKSSLHNNVDIGEYNCRTDGFINCSDKLYFAIAERAVHIYKTETSIHVYVIALTASGH